MLKPFECLVSEEMCSTPMFAFAPIAATTIVKSIVHVQQGQKVSFFNLGIKVNFGKDKSTIFRTSNFLLAILALSAWPGLYTNTFST